LPGIKPFVISQRPSATISVATEAKEIRMSEVQAAGPPLTYGR
jgi:hypothetical protein